MITGPRNSITDVDGILVGNAQLDALKSGVTAIVSAEPATASVHVAGGAPGTRETDLLAPENTVEKIDAIVLSGGSAFGLDAASGVQAWLRHNGRGLQVGGHRVPIVPSAILFDLANGGDKDWGLHPPYRELGHEAAKAAHEAGSGSHVALGSVGAGTGATTAGLKGGLGTASTLLDCGVTIAALAAVNAIGSAVMGDSGHFWAAPFEIGDEFGARGLPRKLPARTAEIRLKYRDMAPIGANTTIAVVATDAILTKAEAKRIAITAHDGFAKALWPSHTPHDGDLIFCVATGRRRVPDGVNPFIDLCAAASSTVARAVARGVFCASPAPGDPFPAWSDKFG